MKHKIYLSRQKHGLGFLTAGGAIRQAVAATLSAEHIQAPCEVSVMLTNDKGIHILNNQFRDVDRSTDVLSFPMNELCAGEFDPDICEFNHKSRRIMLGDMAISLEHAAAQGLEYGHSTKREIQYLTVHSVLHLLGYDHMDEGEMKRQMRSREKEIMAQIEGVKEK